MKHVFVITGLFLSIGLMAQEPRQKSAKSVTEQNVQADKKEKIKQLEQKIAVNETDPTYPAEELKKEKEQLKQLKENQVKPQTH